MYYTYKPTKLKVLTTSLCSRNFENVKLGMTMLKFDSFTATQNLREIKFGNFIGSKAAILAILKALKWHFWDPKIAKLDFT